MEVFIVARSIVGGSSFGDENGRLGPIDLLEAICERREAVYDRVSIYEEGGVEGIDGSVGFQFSTLTFSAYFYKKTIWN